MPFDQCDVEVGLASRLNRSIAVVNQRDLMAEP
jgi:hypothetical protein